MLEILAVLAVFLGVGGLTVGIIAASSAATSKQRLQRLARELGDLRRGLGLVPGVPGTFVVQARDAKSLASGSHPGLEPSRGGMSPNPDVPPLRHREDALPMDPGFAGPDAIAAAASLAAAGPDIGSSGHASLAATGIGVAQTTGAAASLAAAGVDVPQTTGATGSIEHAASLAAAGAAPGSYAATLAAAGVGPAQTAGEGLGSSGYAGAAGAAQATGAGLGSSGLAAAGVGPAQTAGEGLGSSGYAGATGAAQATGAGLGSSGHAAAGAARATGAGPGAAPFAASVGWTGHAGAASDMAAGAARALRPIDPPAPPPQQAPTSFEERIALVWFTRIGALILLLGFGYFFKYATDSGWIGPVGRLLIGATVGVAVLGGAELARARTRPIFLHVVQGVGLGVLYLVVWAAHVFYGLTSAPVAFVGFGAITLAGGGLAVRGRAELVLIFSLVGGFLAPILLSTGADEPLGLFTYLVVLTALAFAASISLRFRIAPWIAVGGTIVLTVGWFVTRFALPDAYPTIASRWPALLGTAAITAEWVVVSSKLRARDHRHTADWLLLGALLFAHGCAAALLHDAPPLLAVVTAGLAGLGAATLARVRRDLLSVPLVASTLVLALADRTDGWAAAQTLAGCAIAMLIYVGALLRGEWRRPTTTGMIITGAASAGFVLVAASTLFIHHPHAFALVVTGVAFANAALALVTDRPAYALYTAIGGFVALFGTAARLDGGHARFAEIAAAWAVIHGGAIAWDLLGRRSRPDMTRLGTLAIAALGLPLLTWWALKSPLLPALDGAALLALGAIMLRRARWAGTLVLAQGVGLLAIATALQFSGATTIMVFALAAAVIIGLAAMSRDGWWLVGGMALLGFSVLILLPDDLHGAARLPFLANWRCATLAVTAASTLAAAFATARARTSWFPIATILLAITGHILLLILALTETHDVVLDSNRYLMAASLVLGVYAAVLLALGFTARNKLHRYLGLALFTITIGKLALVDIWSLERVYQMLVLLGVGALLVAAGFLYARFGRRIVALLKD